MFTPHLKEFSFLSFLLLFFLSSKKKKEEEGKKRKKSLFSRLMSTTV